MGPIIAAVYRKGALYPLTRLVLKEGETIHLRILESAEVEVQDEATRALHALIAAGLVQPGPPRLDVRPVSEQRRRELAQILGAAGPLSDLIIEDRG